MMADFKAIHLGKDERGFLYECLQCHCTFSRKANRECMFCSPECKREHTRNLEHLRYRLHKMEKSKKKMLKEAIPEMAKKGAGGVYGNYGTAQVEETLKLFPYVKHTK